MKVLIVIWLGCLFLSSCASSRNTGVHQKKYPPASLKKDFAVFRGALEESHPSLYWFTPKNKMDEEFDHAYTRLNDSLTERQFRMILLKVITAMRCGHTTINYSKKYSRFLDTADLELFPLAFKVWEDTLAVIGNLNAGDSILRRGTVVTSINNYSAKQLIDTFFNYITGDGFSVTGRYQSLSSFGTFGVLYKNIFGLTDSFRIQYTDAFGTSQETMIPVFRPAPDSLDRTDSLKPEKYTPKERRNAALVSERDIQIDTALKSAYMPVNTFAKGTRVRKFFKYAFRNIDKFKLNHLVIDVRTNGGGDAGNSTLLTRYLADHKFKLADSLYAIKRSTKYRDYIPMQPLYWLMTTLATKKHADGRFHFGYFEKHIFRPRKKHHFNGNVYLLTGGNSFSATTLFVQELKGQKNVKVIGEETGGGAYGNTAWVIPELTLPKTRLRLGIPKFRFVMRRDLVKEGRGVMPDIYAAPTIDDIRQGKDAKIEAVKRLILKANGYAN